MGNRAWRISNRYGAAYTEDRRLASAVLEIHDSRDDAVMATYFSPRGKPFAWQVVFDMGNWDRVSQTLGLETCEKRPAQPTEKRKKGSRRRAKPKEPNDPGAAPRDRKKRT